ncbi:hypothetical protein WJ96_11470 [Burkholderia ubonensis]|uniref:Transposase n=2 Tax=Burkholderia cepacia complex TaxID=87882 RepID=A0AAW3MTJ0_9BURK|nr:hypothetical protein WT26_26095 [Burkholderia cepacia]AOK26144.1 hypothetical protein WK67_25960 [Burkholderia ubonensis]KVN94716.1 hypothetical protein WJ69_05660 [Burkholderia ubonensis]KVP94257.1 hypothetical protein WJ96_11470 [Burkholderia ubonensis]KVU56325.1 hypothetical protein WK68_23760 [Burkholderia ubonensis]
MIRQSSIANVIASAAYCGASGADGVMNWGKNAEKNRYPFGLVTAVRKLFRKIAELFSRLVSPCVLARFNAPFDINSLTPMYAR